MLEQHRGGQRVDITLPSSRRATHFPDGALRGRGREAFVHETHRKSAPFAKEHGDTPTLIAPFGILSFLVQRKPDHKAFCLELAGAVQDLADGWTFPRPPRDVPDWRRDRAGWVAYCQADSSVSEVNC